MVEATIYLPLTICTVLAMLYYGLFLMQQNALFYEVDRIAGVVAREEAYPGYEVFGMDEGGGLDFAWGAATPSSAVVTEHFQSRHETLGDLYRVFQGIADLFGGTGSRESAYVSRFTPVVQAAGIISTGAIGAPEIAIDRGVLSSHVTVTVTQELPLPGILRYFGIDDGLRLRSARTKVIANPGEFVRNVDLAVDATEFFLKKLGLDESVGGFIAKARDVMEKIL